MISLDLEERSAASAPRVWMKRGRRAKYRSVRTRDSGEVTPSPLILHEELVNNCRKEGRREELTS